jgi:tetratricopeptide (TPR) repeat protein
MPQEEVSGTMSLTPRWVVLGLVLSAGVLLAQDLPEIHKPAVHVPRKPESRQDLDRLEAQRLYALGAVNERKNRLVEALKAYEAAQRLDPDAAAIPRALSQIYLALDRTEDALAACRRTLELDPPDYRTAYLQARQLRGLDRVKEAIAVLEKAVKVKALETRPDQGVQVWFELAVLQEKQGDLAGAEKSLTKVAALFENSAAMVAAGHLSHEEAISQAAEAYERLGRVCLKAKAIDRAVRAFEQAQKKDSLRAPRLAYNLAQVLLDQGRFRAALAQLEIFLRTQPQGIEGYEMKLKLQRKLGRDVLPDLAAAAGRDPNNLGLQLLLAREYREAAKRGDAERIYMTLLRRYLDPEIYRGLFALYKDEGRPGAVNILRKLDGALANSVEEEGRPADANQAANARAMLVVLRDDPALVKMLLEEAGKRLLGIGPKLSYPTRVILATLAGRTNQLDAAEKLYRAAMDRPGGLRTMESEVYAGLIEVLQLQHKHADVVEICKLGLAKAQLTNRVLFHRSLVYAYLGLEKDKEALAAADAAVNDAGKAQMLSMKKLRVYALSEAGKHEQAVAECQSMLKEYNQGSELREVRLTLSRTYLAMGKHEESDDQLQMILKADPNDATACNDLAYHWADRGKNLDEAEKLIRKAIDLDQKQRAGNAFSGADADKDNAAFVDSLGWVLFRKGRLAEAQIELERAASLPTGDDDPVVFDHLADVYYRLSKKDKALAAWKKALSFYEKGYRRKSDGRYKEIQEKVLRIRHQASGIRH